MSQLLFLKKLTVLETSIMKIEKSYQNQLLSIDSKLKNVKEIDPFDNFIELMMLFCTSFKLIILGAALFFPWSSVRDFWVKLSMVIFLVKSSKRIRKTWKKAKKEKKSKRIQNEDSSSNETEEDENKSLIKIIK